MEQLSLRTQFKLEWILKVMVTSEWFVKGARASRRSAGHHSVSLDRVWVKAESAQQEAAKGGQWSRHSMVQQA